jgi:predicted NACHT family NTPase
MLPAHSQDSLSIERKLRQLMDERLESRYFQIYVDPKAKSNLKSRDDNLFSLKDDVRRFLSSKREVMLLLGDSGSGKSTFSRHLEQELWQEYRDGSPIPLFITLPSIDNP